MGKNKEEKRIPIGVENVLKAADKDAPITREMIQEYKEKEVKSMIESIIPEALMEEAKALNTDLVQLFWELIIATRDTESVKRSLVSKLNGMVGNIWANNYFDRHGYKVNNEVPILDKTGKKVTASDIVLTDQDGTVDYIELKTTPAIIDSQEDYPITVPSKEDPLDEKFYVGETLPREYYELSKDPRPLSQIAFETGKKLITQLTKTKDYVDRINAENGTNSSVKLCVFKGTTISPSLVDQISNYGEIIELPLSFDKILEFSSSLVAVTMHRGRNMLFPVKNQDTTQVPRGTEWEDGIKIEDIQ